MTESRPTLDTVAKAAGVSRMTVSNAYNRPDQLSAATRERVLAVADALGYCGPDPAGASLRRGRVGSVGVVLTEQLAYAFTDPGLVSFLRGVATELGSAGQAMLVVPTEASLGGDFVRSAIVDAFIMCSMDPDDPIVAAVESRRLPIVTSGSPKLPKAPFVGVDGHKGAILLAGHLRSLGHKRYAVVEVRARDTRVPEYASLPARPGIKKRVSGFVSTLTAAGVSESNITVVTAEENNDHCAAEVVRPLLELPANKRPTAIFGVTDVLALGVINEARALGLEVPDDLSVVGYDDIGAAADSRPALTTISQSLYEQGREAARLALALMDGTVAKALKFAPELVVRASTAPPPRR